MVCLMAGGLYQGRGYNNSRLAKLLRFRIYWKSRRWYERFRFQDRLATVGRRNIFLNISTNGNAAMVNFPRPNQILLPYLIYDFFYVRCSNR